MYFPAHEQKCRFGIGKTRMRTNSCSATFPQFIPNCPEHASVPLGRTPAHKFSPGKRRDG